MTVVALRFALATGVVVDPSVPQVRLPLPALPFTAPETIPEPRFSVPVPPPAFATALSPPPTSTPPSVRLPALVMETFPVGSKSDTGLAKLF